MATTDDTEPVASAVRPRDSGDPDSSPPPSPITAAWTVCLLGGPRRPDTPGRNDILQFWASQAIAYNRF